MSMMMRDHGVVYKLKPGHMSLFIIYFPIPFYLYKPIQYTQSTTTFITILQNILRNTAKQSLLLSSAFSSQKMAIRMPRIIKAKKVLRRSFSNGSNSTSMDIPKGNFAVYVGEQEKKRFVVPVSLLSQPMFQELLHLAEEEFGYNHPMGGLTIPCSEDMFTDLASRLGAL